MVLNPFRMNDWAITTTLTAVAVMQAAVLAFVALDAAGVPAPVLQPLFVVAYLLFIPGMLALRSLRLHRLGDARMLLYSVGLSIAILMFTGLFMNTVYPFFGIERPFSVAEAKAAREAFLTRSTNFVVPIVRIDEAQVGEGRPGPLAQRMRALYAGHAETTGKSS